VPEITRRLVMKAGALLGGTLATPSVAVGLPDARARRRLWYRQSAREWTQALPVGNGRLGAMVFGGTTHERLQLNEDTLWNGGPYDPVNPMAKAALPKGRRMRCSVVSSSGSLPVAWNRTRSGCSERRCSSYHSSDWSVP